MRKYKVAELMTISLLGELDNILNVKSLEDKQFACFKPLTQIAKEGSKGLYLFTTQEEHKSLTEKRIRKFLNHLELQFEHAEDSAPAITAEFLTKYVEQLPQEERAKIYENFTKNIEILSENNMLSIDDEQIILDFMTSVLTKNSTEEKVD